MDYLTDIPEKAIELGVRVLLALIAFFVGAFVDQLADSSVNLGVRCWFKNKDFRTGKWRITENCKTALDQAGIQIPFPQMDVHIQK